MGDIDLPDNSIFDTEDYRRMAEVASSELGHDILTQLEKNDRLSQRELVETLDSADADDIPGTLKALKRVALIRNRRDPDTGRDETYSYYMLTDHGRTIFEQGVEEGVEALVSEEYELKEKYVE